MIFITEWISCYLYVLTNQIAVGGDISIYMRVSIGVIIDFMIGNRATLGMTWYLTYGLCKK